MAYRLRDGIVFQSIDDGAVLLDTRTGQLHTCNPTARSVVGSLDGVRGREELVSILVDEFEVDPATAERDLASLIRFLDENELLAP